MRIVRWSGCLGGGEGVCLGGLCVWPGCLLRGFTPPRTQRQTPPWPRGRHPPVDRHLWKHYLSATTVTDGKKSDNIVLSQEWWRRTRVQRSAAETWPDVLDTSRSPRVVYAVGTVNELWSSFCEVIQKFTVTRRIVVDSLIQCQGYPFLQHTPSLSPPLDPLR